MWAVLCLLITCMFILATLELQEFVPPETVCGPVMAALHQKKWARLPRVLGLIHYVILGGFIVECFLLVNTNSSSHMPTRKKGRRKNTYYSILVPAGLTEFNLTNELLVALKMIRRFRSNRRPRKWLFGFGILISWSVQFLEHDWCIAYMGTYYSLFSSH